MDVPNSLLRAYNPKLGAKHEVLYTFQYEDAVGHLVDISFNGQGVFLLEQGFSEGEACYAPRGHAVNQKYVGFDENGKVDKIRLFYPTGEQMELNWQKSLSHLVSIQVLGYEEEKVQEIK